MQHTIHLPLILIYLSLSYFFFNLTSCAKPNYADTQTISSTSTCAFQLQKLNICVDLNWINPPGVSTYSSFQSRFYIASLPGQNSAPSGTVHFYLWMPSMGHGSSPITTTATGIGEFLSSDVFFIMPGEWEIRLQILNSQGQIIDEARYPLSL